MFWSAVFVAIAIILYLLAPDEYSYSYCWLLHNIYIGYAIYVHKLDKGTEIIGYNTLFSIAFYFTNFVYPIFVYPIDPEFSLFSFQFNHRVITKSTALALLAYTCYGFGYNKKNNKTTKYNHLIDNYQLFPEKILDRWKWIVVLSFIIFYLIGGYEMFENTYQVEVTRGALLPRLMIILMVPLNVLAATFILREPIKNKHTIWYIIFTVTSFSLMSTGTRTLPLMLLIIIFYVYCNSKRLSKGTVAIIICIGVFIMSLIGQIRGAGFSNIANYEFNDNSSIGYFNMVSDLIINNRNLYVFYDYVNEYDVTYGLTMLSNILSPIPFLQSFFVNITGIPDYFLGSASFSTFLTLGVNPSFGLGTNLVGDVYLAFGLVGVVVLFYFLGYLINYLRQKTYEGSYYHTIAYFAMIGDSVYFCRSAFLGNVRIVLWALILGYLVVKVYKLSVK